MVVALEISAQSLSLLPTSSDCKSYEALISSRNRFFFFPCVTGAWVHAGAVQMTDTNKED